MTIIPSKRKIVVFDKSFPEKIKKEVYNKVFEKIKELEITSLYDMRYNYSSEGGFELPKTSEWVNYLDSQNNDIHKYQSSRQLRFCTDNNDNIIGARCKDYINIFTDNELDMICFLVNKVLDTDIQNIKTE